MKKAFKQIDEFLKSDYQNIIYLELNLENPTNYQEPDEDNIQTEKYIQDAIQIVRENMLKLFNAIENCSKLQYLKLNLYGIACLFKIDKDSTINLATALGKLTNLSELELDFNYHKICEKSIFNLCEGLSKLTKITKFSFQYAPPTNTYPFERIYDQGIIYLANTLGQYKNLKYVDLYLPQNHITDNGFSILVENLSKYKNLTEVKLCLRQNDISGKGQALSDVGFDLSGQENLIILELDFRQNSFGTRIFKKICQSIGNCNQLNQLVLKVGQNTFREDPNDFQIAIESLRHIKSLSLQFYLINNGRQHLISDQFSQTFVISLLSWKDVQILQINFSSLILSNQGANYLITGLANCLSLTNLSLQLYKQRIQNEGILNLPALLKSCQNLSILDLGFSQNEIDSKGALVIGDAINNSNCISRLSLDLRKNNIGDEGALYLSQALQKSKIQYLFLDLGDTNMNFKGFKDICQGLQNLTNLISLNISINYKNEYVDCLISFLKALIYLKILSLYLIIQRKDVVNKFLIKAAIQKMLRLVQNGISMYSLFF
ncbi:hypothetical protein ABPG73_007727 [Tetrahymena malaccensis]